MNLDIENLKKKLIDNGLCVDNKFLDKYCLLIINNKSNPKEKFEFYSIKEAGLWWYNTLHPFGERYAECTFQRKIKKSINGEKISYDINHDSNSKHLNKEDIVEITNIKWYKL